MGQQAGDLGAERGGDLRRPGQQKVPRQDGDQIAPPGVDALYAPARRRLVDDVVVVQGTQVDELDRDAAGDHVVVDGSARGEGRSDHERRPEALASGTDEVSCDLGEKRIVDGHGGRKRVLEAAEVPVEMRKLKLLEDVHHA